MGLSDFLAERKISQAEIGRVLGHGRSSAHKKLHSERRWTLEQMQRVLDYLRAKHDPDLTLDRLFGAPPKRQRRTRKAAA